MAKRPAKGSLHAKALPKPRKGLSKDYLPGLKSSVVKDKLPVARVPRGHKLAAVRLTEGKLPLAPRGMKGPTPRQGTSESFAKAPKQFRPKPIVAKDTSSANVKFGSSKTSLPSAPGLKSKGL